eukprot:3306714-Amphidinium_carterae.2
MMIRRESMCVLARVWKVVLRMGKPSKWLPDAARLELVQAMCLLPLMACYLRSPVDERVSASDASEHGGGVCITTRVAETGLAVVRLDQVSQGNLGRDECALVTFGDNVGIAQIVPVREGFDFRFTLAYVTAAGAEQLLHGSAL